MTTRASTPAIAVEHLTKAYPEGLGERAVLRDASCDIARGEFVALVGRSGSGKTTLLNLMGGLDVPTSGDVRIDGVTLSSLSERERTLFRREHLGFVFQFYNLVSTLTVLENVLLPLELNGRRGKDGTRRAEALLAEVGLAELGGAFPDRLSGGEQQRIAVVRALVHDPLVVLADEPTGNLDADTGTTVLALLDDLTRRAGKTLVMATHSSDALNRADRVLRVIDGQLNALPSTSESLHGVAQGGGRAR